MRTATFASVIDQEQRPRPGRKRQGLPPCGADPQCVEPLSGMGDPQGDARPDTRTRGYGCPDQRGGVRRRTGLLKVERRYGDSRLVQYIRLTDGGDDERIDIVADIDWKTPDALLKAEFPMSVSAEEAVYDIGIGNQRRPTNHQRRTKHSPIIGQTSRTGTMASPF